jgi:hypothetical protein
MGRIMAVAQRKKVKGVGENRLHQPSLRLRLGVP